MKPDDPRQWLHPLDCDCPSGAPYHPGIPPRLTWVDLARLGTFGLVIGFSGALVLDPTASAAALAQLLGLGL